MKEPPVKDLGCGYVACRFVFSNSKVWKESTQSFQYLDKYIGRKINSSNFTHSLLGFLDDGTRHQTHHIPLLLKKLTRLYEIISSLPNCRFYSSSLLIIYDGGDPSREIQVKMIDFANCITNAGDPVALADATFPPTTIGPDCGYLLGLETLVSKFEEILKMYPGEGCA